MNIEIIKLIGEGLKHLPPKVLLGLGILGAGYLAVNCICSINASNNGLGFENTFLGIKITPVNTTPSIPATTVETSLEPATKTEPAEGTVN